MNTDARRREPRERSPMQPQPEREAHSRLSSVLSVCEHELAALEALADDRLALIIKRMHAFRLDLVAALEGLEGSDSTEP